MINQQEIETLIRLAKEVMWQGPDLHDQLQSAGVFISRADFYSDIPTVKDIESSREYADLQGEYYSPKLYDDTAMLSMLDDLSQFSNEFNPSVDDNKLSSFFWRNSSFSYSDALTYYNLIRLKKPSKVIEIGGGLSTLIARQALEKNGTGDLWVVEPFPKDFLYTPDIQLIKERVQDLPKTFLMENVRQGDIVFVDSTHTVKVGSDVVHIFLSMVPRIASRCTIHAHDIYLPYPPPKSDMHKHRIFWTEQYLLQAYLTDNPRTRVIWGSYYLSRKHPDLLREYMKDKFMPGGGSFWFELSPP